MPTRSIDKIFVHCSASPETLDIGVAEIRRWHTDPPPKGRGWKDIAYHAAIRRNGKVEAGRPEHEMGAHAVGHNANSLAVCLVGTKDFTPLQMLSLVAVIRGWMRKYNISAQNVFCHYEVEPNKTCPNVRAEAIRIAVA